MFEPMLEKNDNIVALMIGIGSVGCKIIHNLKCGDSEGQLGKLYVHRCLSR